MEKDFLNGKKQFISDNDFDLDINKCQTGFEPRSNEHVEGQRFGRQIKDFENSTIREN